MRRFFLIVVPLVISACSTTSSNEMEPRAHEVLDFCVDEITQLTGRPLSTEVDQAYVYEDQEGAWVIFIHGALGTFGKRSLDTTVVLNCGVLYGPPMKIVFLSAPMKDALIDEPGRAYFKTPEGTTEVLFERKGKKFHYCCSQPFDEGNIDKHNSDFPWNTDHVSS